jgi:brefeldin A-inhibited guanine nucleotide-exchange protein
VLSASAQVKPIIVADMLSTAGAKTSLADITGMTTAVQGFLNNVVAAAGYGAAIETPEQMKQSVAAAIGPRHSMELTEQLPATPPGGAPATGGSWDSASAAAAAVPDVSTSDEDEDEKNTFHLAPASSSDVAAAAAVPAATAGGSSGAADKLANGAPPPAAASSSVQGAARADSSSIRQPGHAGHASAVGAVNQGRALLLKDAFLVFRALCKLSIRTSDSVTISDPTAVRGKVSRCQQGQCWVSGGRHGRLAGQSKACKQLSGGADA